MPTWIWFIILPVVGIVLGWIIRWLYARFQLSASEQKAERVKQDAIREAEAQKKEILLNAKDELIRERNQQERENRERRAEVQRYEARLNKKEELLEAVRARGIQVSSRATKAAIIEAIEAAEKEAEVTETVEEKDI